jgi:hypothetical protein
MIDYPERIGADVVWLPSRLPVIDALERRGWTPQFDTGQSVILARGGGPIEALASAMPSGGVFPWP